MDCFANLIHLRREHFDTYRQHDFGASRIYQLPVKPAVLLAKYEWAERDRAGNNVYDLYYDQLLRTYNATPKPANMTIPDPNPVTATFNGQTITLAQKSY